MGCRDPGTLLPRGSPGAAPCLLSGNRKASGCPPHCALPTCRIRETEAGQEAVFASCYSTAPLGVPDHGLRVLAPWHSTARLGAPQRGSQSPSVRTLAQHRTLGCPMAQLMVPECLHPSKAQQLWVPHGMAQCPEYLPPVGAAPRSAPSTVPSTHPSRCPGTGITCRAGLQPPKAAPAGTAEAIQLVSQMRQGAGTPALALRHCP